MISFEQPVPGDIIARDYRIIELLQQGGMGAVYVAQQLSTGTLRALKLMHPQLIQDPMQRKRFEQEARVGSRIPSDHIVQVLGAGVDEITGMPWLAMELLEGESLAALIRRRGHLPPGEVHEIFVQLCHALSAAHSAGVVHRDLKPENIFLARSRLVGAPSTVKVLDFGIAKIVAELQTGETRGALGTPLWMAPEQTDGGNGIAPTTDVWALGLLAFRLLTGRCYWREGNRQSTLMAILREIVMDPLPSASNRASEYGAEERIPPGFDGWFARCVAREKDARFMDARIALDRLSPLLTRAMSSVQANDRGAAAAPSAASAHSAQIPSAGERLSRTRTREQMSGLAVGGGVIALGLAVAYYYSMHGGQRAPVSLPTLIDRVLGRPDAPPDPPVSAASLQVACDGGDARSCNELGIRAAHGIGVTKDLHAAASLFKKACEGKEATACNELGLLHDYGLGMPKDPAGAAALYEQACDGGEANGCNNLGIMYANGTGMMKDPGRAVILMDRACEGGMMKACRNLGTMYVSGSGVGRDPKRAVALFKRACDGRNFTGCNDLAQMYGSGTGVADDLGKAAILYEQACDGGEPKGCDSLGRMHSEGMGVARDHGRAVQLYKQACDAGVLSGCANLGVNYKTGLGVPAKDPVRARALFKQACDGGEPLGCKMLLRGRDG